MPPNGETVARLNRAEGERRQDLGKDVYVTCQGTRGEFEDGSEEESIE